MLTMHLDNRLVEVDIPVTHNPHKWQARRLRDVQSDYWRNEIGRQMYNSY